MIVCLLGKAGAGKTTIAEALEKKIPDSFIIDGDDLRAETSNNNIDIDGRERNMRLGYSRARWLSDMGFTVFVAMQAPIKEIREEYLKDEDIQILIENFGPNIKEKWGYNKNFSADYSGVDFKIELTDYFDIDPKTGDRTEKNIDELMSLIFKRVLVIARFQGFHKGHKLVMEVAKRLSPDITIGLRSDPGDLIDLDKNINLLKDLGYKVVRTPEILDPEKEWEDFVSDYDIVVQGNPDVIKKFQNAVDDHRVQLKYVPRIGHVSATKIREAIKEGNLEYAKVNVADPKVMELLLQEIK